MIIMINTEGLRAGGVAQGSVAVVVDNLLRRRKMFRVLPRRFRVIGVDNPACLLK